MASNLLHIAEECSYGREGTSMTMIVRNHYFGQEQSTERRHDISSETIFQITVSKSEKK